MSGAAGSPGNVPPHPRMAFKIVREPLDGLTGAVIAKLERGVPADLTSPLTLGGLVLLMAKVAEGMFNTIRHLCGDDPAVGSDQRLWFALSTPPLLRTLVDQIFTIIYIEEDVPDRMRRYLKAGWAAEHIRYERHLLRYRGTSAMWDSQHLLDGLGAVRTVEVVDRQLNSLQPARPWSHPGCRGRHSHRHPPVRPSQKHEGFRKCLVR